MSNSRIEREAMLSRQQIKDMITAGYYIDIVEQNILKLDSWLDRHPGSTKVIEHIVGRNATDEVNA
jgi:delta8-fatty-acid desaturase